MVGDGTWGWVVPDCGGGGAGAKGGGTGQQCGMQRPRDGLVPSSRADLSSKDRSELRTKMALDVGMEGREQLVVYGEQRVRAEEWWERALEGRWVLGRELWPLAGLRHLDAILGIQHLHGTSPRRQG